MDAPVLGLVVREEDIRRPCTSARDERGGLSLSLDVGKFEVFKENLPQDVVTDAEAAHVPTRERVIAKNIHRYPTPRARAHLVIDRQATPQLQESGVLSRVKQVAKSS